MPQGAVIASVRCGSVSRLRMKSDSASTAGPWPRRSSFRLVSGLSVSRADSTWGARESPVSMTRARRLPNTIVKASRAAATASAANIHGGGWRRYSAKGVQVSPASLLPNTLACSPTSQPRCPSDRKFTLLRRAAVPLTRGVQDAPPSRVAITWPSSPTAQPRSPSGSMFRLRSRGRAPVVCTDQLCPPSRLAVSTLRRLSVFNSQIRCPSGVRARLENAPRLKFTWGFQVCPPSRVASKTSSPAAQPRCPSGVKATPSSC